MTIDSAGTVLQELHPTCSTVFYETACINLRSWIDRQRIDLIRKTANEIAFPFLNDEYTAGCDDLETTSITYNHRGEFKRVVAYGPHFLAHDGHGEMAGYVRLWELMLEISPYRSTVAKMAEESWIRKRLRSLFGSIP